MLLNNDRYELAEAVAPLALVGKCGSPLYVYEGETIERQYRRMVDAFAVPRLRIHYACKALTNISVVRFIRGLRAGFEPGEILCTPNCVLVCRHRLRAQPPDPAPILRRPSRTINVSRPHGKPQIYTLVGYICETDTCRINRKIPEILEGDILCLRNAGASCFSMASTYNARYRPAEVFLYKGKDHLVLKREILKDLLRNQIEIDSF